MLSVLPKIGAHATSGPGYPGPVASPRHGYIRVPGSKASPDERVPTPPREGEKGRGERERERTNKRERERERERDEREREGERERGSERGV